MSSDEKKETTDEAYNWGGGLEPEDEKSSNFSKPLVPEASNAGSEKEPSSFSPFNVKVKPKGQFAALDEQRLTEEADRRAQEEEDKNNHTEE